MFWTPVPLIRICSRTNWCSKDIICRHSLKWRGSHITIDGPVDPGWFYKNYPRFKFLSGRRWMMGLSNCRFLLGIPSRVSDSKFKQWIQRMLQRSSVFFSGKELHWVYVPLSWIFWTLFQVIILQMNEQDCILISCLYPWKTRIKLSLGWITKAREM